MGKPLGQADDPLLVSVRSGAKFSMPGMMETVLNIGLNDESVQGLAKQAGNERFAWDSYRRLIQMFGKTVLDIDGEHFEDAHRRGEEGAGHRERPRPGRGRPARSSSRRSRASCASTPAGSSRPTRASRWISPSGPSSTRGTPPRAILYRRQERIPADLGTAVNIVRDGVRQPRHGLRHRRRVHPRPGLRRSRASTATTCRTRRARTSSPASATRCRCRSSRASTSRRTTSCCEIMETLENHYRDLCDIEFTIERNKLWMLQTRVGKRTAGAAFRIATQLVDEGLIDLDEAVTRVTGDQLAQLMFPRFDAKADAEADRQGHERLARAPPSARRCSTPTGPRSWPTPGEDVILVRRETNPDDLDGMIAAQGILTSRGGKTSHAAVVARGMGKTCVCGAEELEVDTQGAQVHRPRRRRRQGGRRHLHRRHLRRGLPRRGAGAAVPGRASTSRASSTPTPRTPHRAGQGRAPA